MPVFRTSNVEYRCSPALHMCGCECCVCVLCMRPCRCLLSRVRACARARPCACMLLPWTCARGHVCWRTQACECECRTSAVLSHRRCSANYATTTELLSSVRFRLVVDDLQPAPPYAPDNTSHAIKNRSPATRAKRNSTRAIEATQETARCRSAADQRDGAYVRRQRIRWTPELV